MKPLKVATKSLHCLPATVTFSDAAVVAGNDDVSHRHARRQERDKVLNVAQEENLCGSILASMEVPLEGEQKAYTWYFLNPMALIFKMASIRPEFGDLLHKACVQDGYMDLVLYFDEIKPGNILRPDSGRAQLCIYFTFGNLPHWARSRAWGWWHFGSFPMKLLAKVPAGASFLMARVLDVFFGRTSSLSFADGVPCIASCGAFVLRAHFKTLVADEKALKEAWSLKGASGTKPCYECANVVGHCAKEDVNPAGWLQHLTCADRSKFQPHTESSFRNMANKLAATRTASERNKLGQAYGLTYHSEALLWDGFWGERVSPIRQSCWDWMHVIVASGGVAAYECNSFLCELKRQGIPLSTLNTFACKWNWPKARDSLSASFFEDRLQEDGEPLRAFAGEMLDVVVLLDMFQQHALKPHGSLPRHCRSLELLARILEILLSGDRAISHVDELEACVDEHATLFVALYEHCAKPKFHMLFHVGNAVRRFGNLSCWGPERKHRVVKSLAPCPKSF